MKTQKMLVLFLIPGVIDEFLAFTSNCKQEMQDFINLMGKCKRS